MNLKEATKTFGIPANIISRMEKEGLIGFPLDEAGIHALSVLSQLWGRPWFIGASLKGIRARERSMLFLFPGHDKIDRYILNTFLGEPYMKKVPTEVLRYRIKMGFGADVESQRIRNLRNLAVAVRGRKKKLVLGHLSLNYADILGV
jgi:hypothetical protein